MQKYADREHPRKFIVTLCALGVIMLIAALCSHPPLDYLKDTGYSELAVLLPCCILPIVRPVLLADGCKGKTPRFDIIKPAGTATLTCYIIPYIWYAAQQLLGWHYPELLNAGAPGLLRSLIFSLIIVQLTGLLVKAKIKLKV